MQVSEWLAPWTVHNRGILTLKGEFNFSFIRELDVPPLGESNLMGPKKSVEVKFFTIAFFGEYPTLAITLGAHFAIQSHLTTIYDQLSLFIISCIFAKHRR